jgi:MFS family permease
MLTRIGELLPATRHRDFRALWGGSACSSIALWTLLLGNGYIVHKLSDSSFWVGVATFATMSPYFIAPLSGTIADRVERRWLVRVTRIGTFAITLGLLLIAITNVIEVWMVVAFAFATGLVRSVEIPADQALLPAVVPFSDRASAVALQSTSQHGSRAVGALLSAPLLSTIGVEGAYGVSAVFALLSFVSVSQVRTSSRGGVTRLADVAENLREGLAYVRSTPPVLAIFILVVAHCSLTMSFDSMLPGFAEDELHRPSGGLTVMTFGVGIGALVGTLVLSLMTGFRRGPLLFATALVSGLSPLAMSVSHQMESAVVSSVLMGSSQAMFMALSAVLLQEVVPDAIRGRVMSLYLMAAGGIMAIMNLGFGALADHLGTPVLFAVPGLAFVAFTVLSLATGPHLRRIYRTGGMASGGAHA